MNIHQLVSLGRRLAAPVLLPLAVAPVAALASIQTAPPRAPVAAPADTADEQVLPRRAPPQVGEPFGPLVLPTIDRAAVIDLADYRGRRLLLIEFASW